jgi:hypothetical protein
MQPDDLPFVIKEWRRDAPARAIARLGNAIVAQAAYKSVCDRIQPSGLSEGTARW